MKNKFKVFLFDLDGLLLDTEKIYVPCWIKAAKYYGYTLEWNDALRLRSLDSNMAMNYIGRLFQNSDCYTFIRQKRKELMNNIILKSGIQIKPGAVELLKYLNYHQIQSAIVTSSSKERANYFLKLSGLSFDIRNLISAADLKKGKPFPDIYVYACTALNIKPDDCVALEDSPNGILSAYKAG